MPQQSVFRAAFLALALCHAPGAAIAGPQLLFEAVSGRILFADDVDVPWHPASLTKLLTTYVVFEELKAGRVALDTKLALSDYARGQPATRIGLRLGIELNVEQALRGLILRSANDFAVALAEGIAGSEDAFVARMNDTARRLGMTRSQFRNPHGLPHDEQVTSARDMGLLAHALLRDFPDRSEFFASSPVRIHRQNFHSQNDLLRVFEGADGMKTGFTCGAGYNVVASATRDGVRLIAVVLGEQTRQKRSLRAAGLLQHGFEIHAWRDMLPAQRLAAMPPAAGGVTLAADASQTMRMRKCRVPGRAARVAAGSGTDAGQPEAAKAAPPPAESPRRPPGG
jgi:D-alanyl-D-alanine carboxypeptidase